MYNIIIVIFNFHLQRYGKHILKIGTKYFYTFLEFLPTLLIALIALIVGRWLVKIFHKRVKKIITKYQVDPSLGTFLSSFSRISLIVGLVIIVISILGVPTSSIIALFGAMGLGIGFALQGSLSNVAGGLIILYFKPFIVGDTIETDDGKAGEIKRIDLMQTTLEGFNNQIIIVPNSLLITKTVINYTKNKTRRITITLGLAYNVDMDKVRKIILDLIHAENDTEVAKMPAPYVIINQLGDSSVQVLVRCWVDVSLYVEIQAKLLEKIKKQLDLEKIEFPFPQRVVHLQKP